jgi:hypothetical protein
MDIYLPIAEISVNLFLLLGLGGWWFPGVRRRRRRDDAALILLGISPAVAVGTGQPDPGVIVLGVIAHMRRGNVDVRMGLVLWSAACSAR